MPTWTRRLPRWSRSAARAFKLHVVQSYAMFFARNLPRALWPRTFADHVRRKMLFDRRPYLAITADKVRVGDYVRDKVGEHVLTKAYAIAEDPRTIDWSAVLRTYVRKATHACGGVIVVSDEAGPDARLPTATDSRWRRAFVRPERATPDETTEVCLRWVNNRFGWGPGSTHEHQFCHITPRVLVEELLRRPDGALAYDYKLHVFHGRCELIVLFAGPWDDRRVDLHDLGDRVVFGELTNTPGAGVRENDPAFDRLMGTFWRRGGSTAPSEDPLSDTPVRAKGRSVVAAPKRPSRLPGQPPSCPSRT